MNLFGLKGEGDVPTITIFKEVENFVNVVFAVFVVIVLVIAIFYAIYVGYRLAKAEDEGKRKEAKQQLLWALIGGVAAVAIFALLTAYIIPSIDGSITTLKETEGSTAPFLEVVGLANVIIGYISSILGILATIFTMAATVFCVYIIFRFVRAEDEGKRKECKKQLLWSFIAILGVMIIIALLPTIWSSIGLDSDLITPEPG
jgi:heme/copper-type cytochrome/quinol oxidase subunit 2